MKILITVALAFALLPSSAAWAQYLPERPSREEAIQAQRQQDAVQPGNNAPVWREVQSGVPNSTTVRGVLLPLRLDGLLARRPLWQVLCPCRARGQQGDGESQRDENFHVTAQCVCIRAASAAAP